MQPIITRSSVLCLLILFLGCADEPTHSNIFDPDTPNDPPNAVALRPDLINYITNTTIDISWTESGDDDFFLYNVYRSVGSQATTQSTLIGQYVYPFQTSVNDTGLQPNTAYYYSVNTEDKGGLTTASNELALTTAPDIYRIQRFVAEGSINVNLFLSKMDVFRIDNFVYMGFAGTTVSWDLRLLIKEFDSMDVTDRGTWYLSNYLIIGDSDGDGEPDLYEILYDADPDNADDFPGRSYVNYPSMPPMQCIIMKDESSQITSIFVLYITFPTSKIMKFTGNLDANDFQLDATWFDNGIMSLYGCYGIMSLSASQLLVSHERSITIFGLSGNEEFNFTPGEWLPIMSVGRDSPSGTDYIYMTNWSGLIYKFDIDGNLLATWQGSSAENTGHLSPIGLYADYQGNVFISDQNLGTINRFNSEGDFISRWYGSSFPFENRFGFDQSISPFGQASISGDKANSIFIIDQHPEFYRTKL